MKNEKIKATLKAVNVGFAFGVGLALRLLIYVWVGRWLDGKLGTDSWFSLAGLLLAISSSFYHLFTELTGNGRGSTEESSEGERDE